MKLINIILTLTFFCLSIFNGNIHAQTDKELLAELAAEEQEAINALVLYPKETRQLILETTLYPEALIQMESIQSRTSTAFRELMESLPKSSQEMIWDLTRYPGLIHQLALQRTGGRKTTKQILADYPEVIHRRATDAALDHDLPLVVIDQLDLAATSAFQNTLSQYPPEVQGSLKELIELPEVLSILTENIRLTLLVGHVYKKDPEWIIQKTDSVHLELARQNAQEVEDWKKSLEDNPQAMSELKSSVETYNEEYGYDDDYYRYEGDDIYDEPREEVIVHHHHYDYHYPYWFGYPYWYAYPRWRYYPTWYDWGFYFYPSRPVIVIGLPSIHFTHWFFNDPYHHHHYSHLSAHFVGHYHGHRRSGASITTTVTTWQHRNRAVVSEKWMKNDGKLSKRFEEYGKFETSRKKYNRKNPKRQLDQKEYIKKNERRYPSVSKSSKEQKVTRQKTIKDRNTRLDKKVNTKPKTRDYKKPKVKDRKEPSKQTDRVKKKPSTKTNRVKKKKDKSFERPKARTKDKPKIKSGKDYHKNTWNKSKNKRTKPKVSRKPKVKTKKRKPSKRKTRKPGRKG